MKRNSDLRNTWSSCVMQMLKRQTRVKGAVLIGKVEIGYFQESHCVYLNFVLQEYLFSSPSCLYDFCKIKITLFDWLQGPGPIKGIFFCSKIFSETVWGLLLCIHAGNCNIQLLHFHDVMHVIDTILYIFCFIPVR